MTDEEKITDLIAAHFEPMQWDQKTAPDWDRFRLDFHPGALLCGAARPMQIWSLEVTLVEALQCPEAV